MQKLPVVEGMSNVLCKNCAYRFTEDELEEYFGTLMFNCECGTTAVGLNEVTLGVPESDLWMFDKAAWNTPLYHVTTVPHWENVVPKNLAIWVGDKKCAQYRADNIHAETGAKIFYLHTVRLSNSVRPIAENDVQEDHELMHHDLQLDSGDFLAIQNKVEAPGHLSLAVRFDDLIVVDSKIVKHEDVWSL